MPDVKPGQLWRVVMQDVDPERPMTWLMMIIRRDREHDDVCTRATCMRGWECLILDSDYALERGQTTYIDSFDSDDWHDSTCELVSDA